MMLEIALLIFFLLVLSKASDKVVENAARLSAFFGISHLAIGFLLISVLTSLPELSVAVTSSLVGEGAISAGNVFGANIANILFILGLGAFLYGLKVQRNDLREIGAILVLTTMIAAYIILNSSVGSQSLGFAEGFVLLALFAAYSFHLIKKGGIENNNGKVDKKEALKSFIVFTAAIVVVIISAGFVVEYAVKVAGTLHVAESFIGATVIALGTTLPELSISIKAIRKKRYGLALGTTVGSTMTNMTLVLGTAAVINPIFVFLPVFIAPLLFAIVANALLFYVAAVEHRMGRPGGAVFLLVYLLYLAAIFYLQASEVLQ